MGVDLRAVSWRFVSRRTSTDGTTEYRVLQYWPPVALGSEVPWRQSDHLPHGRRDEPRD